MMFGDTSNLPISGGILLSAVAYGAISLMITGPVVAERTIERGEWKAQCQHHLKQNLRANEPAPVFVPKFNCRSLLGMFGGEGSRICNQYGNPSFNLPGMDQLEAHQKRVRELKRGRLEMAVGDTASRCDCAASIAAEKARVSFAIYAGSARLITPTSIKNLGSTLKTSLRSPLCAAQNR